LTRFRAWHDVPLRRTPPHGSACAARHSLAA